jgi:hypothetical protein
MPLFHQPVWLIANSERSTAVRNRVCMIDLPIRRKARRRRRMLRRPPRGSRVHPCPVKIRFCEREFHFRGQCQNPASLRDKFGVTI